MPAKWKPHWHFYTTPISPDPAHPDSPVRFLKHLARPEDFVAFKVRGTRSLPAAPCHLVHAPAHSSPPTPTP